MKIQQIIDNVNRLNNLFVLMIKMMPDGFEICESLSCLEDILKKEKEYLEAKYD